ncbi:MAG: S8 family serine peptidase [Desulfobacterales bacterium]|nr:S8 family serine peptidase [Desulfobacterales bacterium]
MNRGRTSNKKMGGSKLKGLFLIAAVVLFFQANAKAQILSANTPGLSGNMKINAMTLFHGPDQKGKDGLLVKIGYDLTLLHVQFNEHKAMTLAQGKLVPFTPVNSLIQVFEDQVIIEAVAKGDPEALVSDLKTLGMENAVSFGGVVNGRLPINALSDMAGLDSLRFARPAYRPRTHAGLTTSQGDIAQNSDDARTNYGVNGNGITVGTLSDSYDNHSGTPTTNAAADVASGDLPTGITVLDDTGGPGIDEGRGMMQLIHDVAPGASQMFHTAFNGQADFAQGILDLDTAGCHIIVDDVYYYAEPWFQDGIIAQAVDTVVGNSKAYFSSAGNQGRDSYEAAYNAGTPPSPFPVWGDSIDAHDFAAGTGDFFQSVTLADGETIIVVLQWNEPYASATGGSGSASDLDIFLLDDPLTGYWAASFDVNGGADPIEVMQFTNDVSTTGATAFNIYIERWGGPAPSKIKYILYQDGTVNEYVTNSSTLAGHANADGACAVGAANFWETPPYGQNPPLLTSYSSAGPTPILFDASDNPISETRNKPEIVAPDGGNTTFFGSDVAQDADSYPNFRGTSASAPHAAAVAALMLEAAGGSGSLTPAEIYSGLEFTADDMMTPGFDYDSGYGLINADSALSVKFWDGTGSSNWHTAGNWTASGVPAADDPVIIPDASSDASISTGNATAQKLLINGNRHLEISDYMLTIE